MAVDNAARYKLHTSAKRVLGDEEGDTLMELLPPKWDEFATKHDLQLAKQELLTALNVEIRTAITSQTKAFIWTNAGLVVALTGVFGTLAVILR